MFTTSCKMNKLSKNNLLLLGALLVLPNTRNSFADDQWILKSKQKELKYYQDAAKINDLLFEEGLPVRTKVIVNVLKTVDCKLPKYFPNGPFTREDLVAMAWLESAFNQYEVGTHGERGIFQIMPGEFKEHNVYKNKYDIATNTEICLKVLSEKYRSYPDYKKSIIAYNGLVYSHGKLSQKYWRAFEKRKIALENVLENDNSI
jgi:hypothetical protein